MTPYDRIRGVSEKARRALHDWEKDCIDFSHAFLKNLQRGLGWPDHQFERIEPDQVSDHARVVAEGYTDQSGFHFAVRIDATDVSVHVSFVARKHADGEGFDVEAGSGRTFTVSPKQPETMQPVTDHIARVMEEQVLAAQFAQVVGFEPTSR